VITESPFLFSIAALSASLAGLAGLVAGLRRGEGLSSLDLFRLREIVEFAFANVLLAISTVPLTTILGSAQTAVRIVAVAAILYIVAVVVWLVRRQRSWSISGSGSWYALAILVDAATLVAAAATILDGTAGPFEAMLVALLARPMLAFAFVLASFERR
jgi:hypothetical protein